MNAVTREELLAYIDDTLSATETARIEKALREAEPLRQTLRQLIQERDRGEHSVGAIWRRNRLSCATREQLGSYLLAILADEHRLYIDFHITTIGCAYCLANLTDLKRQQQEDHDQVKRRRSRYYESSAGLVNARKKQK